MSFFQITEKLQQFANEEKAKILRRFFKTGKGEYAEGDIFIGLTVPQIRTVAKSIKTPVPFSDLQKLIYSEIHEFRMCGFLLLMEKYKESDTAGKKEVFEFYLKHTKHANNWDLVDLSCGAIIGDYLLDKNEREILYKLAESENLWEQRISIVSALVFIKKMQFEDTFALAEKFLSHPHDLMHKATGWMLREIGKKDKMALTDFLEKFASKMPRTMLRYAIEHFSPEKRQYFLAKKSAVKIRKS